MPRFVIKVDGVPIPVDGVANEKEARAAVAEAVRSNPGLVAAQKEHYLNDASMTTRFAAGFEDSVDSFNSFVKENFLRLVGRDEQADETARTREANAAVFEELDEQSIAAEDFGQFFGDPVNLAGGLVVGGLVAKLARALTPTKLAGSALGKLIGRSKATAKEVMEGAASPQGKKLAQELADVAQTNPKAADQAFNAITRSQRDRVRQAQVNIQQQLRAQQQAAQEASSAARAQAQAQAEALAQQQARSAFSRFEQQAGRKASQAELRELIRRANSGQ